ncbi:inter-alpha-trypsin inhibitor heavy chain H4-like isoform X2 [Harmonia axyridis]|uniref:inter-alpha-trypsin inhibitor heavy chain H4-like isoform X2 n=1 Tax=Harmonia axyridis TaxID=115357 RepID=UPI001E2755CF|nr:inter-alpha-trypsin inhibitor heavy chain H4-like isoform X2 [Harmonia axyridis]
MKFLTTLLIPFLHLTYVFGAPSSTESWVATSTKSPSTNNFIGRDECQNAPDVPKIYSMKVNSNVTNRFATTRIVSKVKNCDVKPHEATFSVVLPDTAYINGFIMEIDGKKYEAYIKEKEEAKKVYDQAVSRGLAAGHVAINARDSNKFTVSINIMPESKAIFYLTYEELLSRQKGLYDIVINLRPGQPVDEMEAQVNINETRPLTTVITPSLRSGNELTKNNEIVEPKAEIKYIGKNSAKVIFKPDIIQQKEFAKELGTEEENGFVGQFVVQYDVERDAQGGELLFADGYFVHFFAPKDVKPEPKNIIFVLDTSGSMWGTPINQLKEAMNGILNELHAEDSFNIIQFSSGVTVWDVSNSKSQYLNFPEEAETLPGTFEASEENIRKAKQSVNSFSASGLTNIDAALRIALKLHSNNKEKDERQPIIMFLTDGQGTGVRSDVTLSRVSEENTDGIPIICVAFGERADMDFLEKLSLRNHGFTRHIYTGADAAIQLKSFYEIISTLLLNKITFKYASGNVSEVTKSIFPTLFKGAELVVAGKYRTPAIDPGFYPGKSVLDLSPMVNCFSKSVPREFKPLPARSLGSLEKHWAYLTLKQILKERDVSDKKEELTKRALDLALKYSFVTPVSSLVVVKPNGTKSEADLKDAYKTPHWGTSSYSTSGVKFSPSSYGTNFLYTRYYDSPSRRRISPSNYVPQLSSTLYLRNYDLHMTTPAYRNSIIDGLPILSNSNTDFLKKVEKMKKELTWFNDAYNAENATIDLKTLGKFSIGNEHQITKPYAECPKTPLNGKGHCVLLGDCPQVYPLLDSLTSYIQFFCPLEKFAGVCCPTTNTTKKT